MLTVQEALQHPVFSDAVVTAGHGGLQRTIRWVHILEVADIETLIHGEEMILTTGIAFHSGAISSVLFLEKLISHNACCLCIEIGAYFESASEELVALSNQHQFPLILFHRPVRFVDITQELHALIINHHYQSIKELEGVSRQFHRLSLSAQGTLNVLKLLHESTHAQIIYQTYRGHLQFVPSVNDSARRQLLRDFDIAAYERDGTPPGEPPYLLERGLTHALIHPVGAMSQTWGYLTLIFSQQPHHYHKLLLDSASLSISQELLRTQYMEERKLYTEHLWVDELLNEQMDNDEQIKAAIGPSYKKWNETRYRVCLIEFENPEDLASYFHISMIVRSSFEKFSFHPLITIKNNRIAVIALDLKTSATEKSRMKLALESVHAKAGERLHGLNLLSGAGNPYTKLKHAVSSYQEAIQALSLHACYKQTTIFYEELGIFQLLLNLNNGVALQAFVDTYLGPVIEHDRIKNSRLLLTLKVFLDCDGSKQAAAQKLFIVRQSLYYRLNKISELLASDFMAPEQRLSVQVALRAYQLLHPGVLEDR